MSKPAAPLVLQCFLVLWFGALVLSYSFNTDAFPDLKLAVLALGLPVVASPAVRGRLDARRMLAWLPAYAWLACAFAAAAVRTESIPHVAWLRLFPILVPLAAVTCLQPLLARDEFLWPRLQAAVYGAGSLAACLALLQGAGMLQGLFPPFPEYGQPMYSVFGNQAMLGGFSAACLALAPGLAQMRRHWKWRTATGGAAAILAATVVLSGSIAAWLAAGIGLGVSIIGQGCPALRTVAMLVLPGIAAAILAMAVSPEIWLSDAKTFGQTLGLRLWFWMAALRMFFDHPIAGIGLGQFSVMSPAYQAALLWDAPLRWIHANDVHTHHAHNALLEMLAEGGLVGAALLLWLGVRISRGLRASNLPVIAAMGTFALLQPIGISPPHVVLLLAACGHAMVHQSSEQGKAPLPAAFRALAIATFTAIAAGTVAVHSIPSIMLRQAAEREFGAVNTSRLYFALDYTPWRYRSALTRARAASAQGNELDAYAAYTEASRGIKTGGIQLERGALLLRHGGHGHARRALREAVYLLPSNADAWRLYLALLPPAERSRAAQDARRFLTPQELNMLEEEDVLPTRAP